MMKDLIPLAKQLGSLLVERGETIGVSESSSGGLISAALLAVPGASRFYRGGGVIYTPQAFKGLMALTKEDITGMRSSTEPYARFMAGQMRDKLRATWGLCETGASGPDGNGYGDAAGHTCVALVGAAEEYSRTLETGLTDREENMFLFTKEALEFALETLASKK